MTKNNAPDSAPLTGPAQAGRLDKSLSSLAPALSRVRLQSLIEAGQVKVGGKVVTTASHKLKGGEMLELIVPQAVEAEPQPENIPLDIVYEDNDLLVINKPAGMVVHPAAGHTGGTLVNALLYHCGASLSGINGVKRPGIVHRLDKETSGLMVVAKNDAAHQGLAAQFADHSLSRRYEAAVWGLPNPPTGTIDGAIGRAKRNRKKMAVVAGDSVRARFYGDDVEEAEEMSMYGEEPPAATPQGRHAVTHYETLKGFGLLGALLSCQLETGRTHQIRVHLSSIGHSVMGDPVYGRAKGAKTHKSFDKLSEEERNYILDFPRQALHAAEIRFIHPVTGKEIVETASMPDDMQKLITLLGKL